MLIPGAIDDLHRASAQPALLAQDIPFQAPGDLRADEFQGRRLQASPRLAVGAGRTAGSLLAARPLLPPSLHPAHDLQAGRARTQDLRGKRPESHLRAEQTLPGY
ncbi:MAG: hypothetical protein WDN28_22350 [Chthoniobacter sp.]